MKILSMLLCSIVLISSLDACVTYNKSTNTYTVDNNGYRDHGHNHNTKSNKSKYNR